VAIIRQDANKADNKLVFVYWLEPEHADTGRGKFTGVQALRTLVTQECFIILIYSPIHPISFAARVQNSRKAKELLVLFSFAALLVLFYPANLICSHSAKV
jgi:hypothetical protein